MDPVEITREVDRIVTSETFIRSDRLCRFLKFVVEQSLEGRGGELKEYLIGVEVYAKGVDFDPRLDSAVRVDARRLRAKLAEYYAGEGADNPIRIVLPKGGYQPEFHPAPARSEIPPLPVMAEPEAETLPPAAPPSRSWWRIAALWAALAAAAVLGVWFWPRKVTGGSGEVVRSIAVIPFTNMTGRAANDSLCVGLAEELNDRLNRAGGLKVISRTLVANIRPQTDPREIARQLQVESLLLGSVREGAEALRISVQLVRGRDGSQVWSESFDLVKGDELGMQARIGQTIERRLAANLPQEAQFKPEVSEEEQRLNNLVIQAGFLAQRRTRESLLKAIDYAQQGAKGKPDYAPAYAVLGDAYLSLAGHESGAKRRECVELARRYSEKALELNGSLAGPYATLASLKLFFEWNWAEANDLFRRGLALNPNHAIAHARYAQMLTFEGRADQAQDQAHHAELLAPISVLSFATLGQADYYSGRYLEAVEHLRRALEVDPGYDPARQTLTRALELGGRRAQAWAEVEKMPKPYRESDEPNALVAWLFAREGKFEQARASLRKAPRASIISRVGAHAALGESKIALDLLADAVAARDPDMVFLKVSPVLDPLRRLPRLEELCREVRLEGCVR